MPNRAFRMIALILVFTVLIFSFASCAGKFSLTHKLLNWNLSLNKWLGSFLLFVFIILPVYGICLLIDWVILNVIEFYSGNNPVAANSPPATKTAVIDGRQVSLTMYPGKGVNLDLATEETDGSVRLMMVRTTENGVEAKLIENGKESLITARPGADGDVVRCVESQCRSIDREEQSAMLEEVEGLDRLLAEAH
ncbi:MAG: DUF3332 family protein [Myxococcales bacterium]|nr:DUF3332 family protein [Myxococcales bacterium]